MPLISIAGISVDFPKSPYKCQVDYMEHVIRALNTNSNALLESPTGTGKTLCLLCATLAWQDSRRGKPMELAYSAGSSVDAGAKGGPSSRPAPYTIVYATRTHSQLAQVVSELRETSYRPRMTVMGSREQLCIHEKISKLKSSVLNHACNSLNSKRSCMYRNNLDNYIESGSSMDSTALMDIEEMVKLGNHRKICPYFHSREFSTSSDLVLLPYNYLLDSTIRRTLKLDWSKCIVIFDEAHNLERVAADAASFSLSSTDLALCIQEMKQVLTKLKDDQDKAKAPSEAEALQKLNVPATAVSSGNVMGGILKPTLAMAVYLLKALFELERRIDGLQVPGSTGPVQQSGPAKDLNGLVYPGEWLGQLLLAVGLSTEQNVDDLRRCCNMLMEIAQDALAGESAGAALSVEPKLNALTTSLDRVVRSSRTSSIGDYKVYIADEAIKYSNAQYTQVTATGAPPPRRKRVVNYWCFSTGVAMNELQALGVKSLLLTSGTLSPMAALREDIKLPFPVQLENPHVISDNQMWVAAVATGTSGKTLNSSFQSRDTSEYKDELGASVLQICLTMAGRGEGCEPSAEASRASAAKGWEAYGVSAPVRATPPPPVRGGVLIFFPSYAVMEAASARWKETGVYERLRGAVGSVLMEPRGSGNTNIGDNKTYQYKNGPSGNFMTSGGVTAKAKSLPDDEDDEQGGAEFRTIVGQFEHAIKTYGGCVLLAVCRGKVSEGIDFTDNKGRVVIITGIPFAPFMDPWVVLKKQYLDEKSANGGRGTSAAVVPANPLAAAGSGTNAEIISAFHRQVAPSAYPAVMGPPAAAPAASSAGTGMASLLPPPPPLVAPPGAIATAVVAPKPPVLHTLTGLGWYSQSAGRAVNQCIGRVIRHNRDWGTVFLLDDRFMQDRQVAQLSGWVKPRVKKYTSFSAAMKSFRSFITTAAQDKTLVSKAMMEQMAAPQPDIERFRRRELDGRAPDEVFHRQVEISESALADASEDNTFINPSFLLSQQPTQRPAGSAPVQRSQSAGNVRKDSEGDMMSIFQRGKPASSSSSSLSAEGSQSADNSAAGSSSLLSAFARAKEKTSAPSAAPAVDRTSGNANGMAPLTISYHTPAAPPTSSSSQKSTAGVAFGLAAAQKAPSFHVPEKVVRTMDSTIADYFAAPAPSQPSSSQAGSASQRPLSQLSQSQAAKRPVLNIPKMESTADKIAAASSQTQGGKPQSFLSYLSQLDDEIHYAQVDPVTDFHNNIAILKEKLSKDKLLALKSKLMFVKNNFVPSTAGLRQFVGDVVALLQEADARTQYNALISFACMLPADANDAYMRMVTDAVDAPSSARKASSSVQGVSGAAGAKKVAVKEESEVSLSQKNINSHIRSVLQETKRKNEEIAFSQSQSQQEADVKPGGALRYVPSKRAMSMLSSSQSTSSSASVVPRTEIAPLATGLRGLTASMGPPAAAKPSFLAKLGGLEDIALTGAVRAGNLASTADRHSRVGSSKLTCAVCKEKATSPCAGRCGHVCCQECWTKWLKVNASCPLCRAPASSSSVTRLLIK